jgi:hypothetical protein
LELRASVKCFVSLQFLNLRASVGLESVRPKTATWHKYRINTNRHSCFERDSNPRSECSRGRRYFMP